MLDLADEVFEHVELGRDLGPADYGGYRRLRRAERGVECPQFRFHRAPRIGGEEMRQPLGRGVGAVRGGEGIVDVEIAVRRNRLGEFGIVRFLARPEPHIVEQPDIAIAQDADRLLDHGPRDFGDEHDFLVQNPLDIALHHAGAHGRVALALGPAEMREQQDLGALVRQLEDGLLDRLDAGDVAGAPLLHRQVEIDAHQRDLAGYVAKVIKGPEFAHLSVLRGTSPSRRWCRSCGSRSPTRCRTS